MADREAKVTFRAETEEFRDAIKSANSEMSSLRSELKLSEAQFRNTGDSTTHLSDKSRILESQLEANQSKQEALNSQIEVATELFGADSQEVANLERQLNYTMAQEENLQSQLDATNSELDASQSATGQLTSTIAEQETELQSLKDAYADAVISYGDNSSEAQALAGEIQSLSGELAQNQQQMADARAAADELDGSMSSASGDVASSADTMADAVANAGVAASLKEIGDAALDMAGDFSEATADIVEGTGTSGESLKELQGATLTAFGAMKNASGSLGDAAGVVAELNTRLGITGDEAADTATKILNFAQHTGTDAVGAVDSIVDVMKRWGMSSEDMDGLLDDLVTGNQACSLSIDDFTSNLSQNSVQFQELGYSSQDAIALLSSFADGGANVSAVTMGMKQAVKNLSGETDNVPAAFQQAITAMQEADSVSDALNATVGDTGLTISDTFGSRAAQEIAAVVQQGGFSIDSFTESLENNQGALASTTENATTMGDEMSRVGNSISVIFDTTLAPAITGVISVIADLVADFADFVANNEAAQGVFVAVAAALTVLAVALGISSLIQAVTSAMSLLNLTMLANPVVLVVAAIAALVAAFVYLWNTSEEFRNFWTGLWEKVRSAASTAWNAIKSVFSTVVNAIFTVVTARFRLMQTVISTVFNAIKGIATTVWNGIKSAIINPLETAKNTVSNIINAIKGFFSFSISWPHIPLPHFSVKPAGWQVGDLLKGKIPTLGIDWYAKGGYFDAPSVIGVGEAGPEAVLPLNDMVFGNIASGIAAHIGASRNITIINNFSGSESPEAYANTVVRKMERLGDM